MFKASNLCLIISVFIMSFLVGYYVLGVWTEPGTAPPGGNVSAPINIGSTAQTKSGDLKVAGLILNPASQPTCDAGAEGKMYYDSTADKIYYCNGTAWGEMGGAGWTLSGFNLYTAYDVGIGTTGPSQKLEVVGTIKTTQGLDLKGAAFFGVSSAGQGRIYFDSTDNRFRVSENAGNFQYLITSPSIFYKQYCCWRCHGSNNTGTPDSCSGKCAPSACYAGDTDYGIQGVMTGGGVTTTGNPSASSVQYGLYFNGYGYYYRLCATTKPVYETSCCWRCHGSDTTGKPMSCTHTCTPPPCNSGDTDLSTTTVGVATFTGSGLNDMWTGGTFTGGSSLNYKVQIDGTGTPNTFKWSDDGGSTWDATTVAITGSNQTLNNGVTVKFIATTGHTSEDYWTFSTALVTQGSIALGGSISIMGPIGGMNTADQKMTVYAIGYGHSIRNCRKN